jgi:hypothetical protein
MWLYSDHIRGCGQALITKEAQKGKSIGRKEAQENQWITRGSKGMSVTAPGGQSSNDQPRTLNVQGDNEFIERLELSVQR